MAVLLVRLGAAQGVIMKSTSGGAGNRTRVFGRETNGVYRLSRRLNLASRGPRRRATTGEQSLLECPLTAEASRSGEPVSEAGAPPHGRGRTDSHRLASN